MNDHLFIGSVFIVEVSDRWFTFIEYNCYMLVIVLVTLDIDLEVVVSFWFWYLFCTWYLYIDLVCGIGIRMSVLLILITSSSCVVCVTLEVVLAIGIPCLGVFYDSIVCVWIVHYLSCIVWVGAWLGGHAVGR